MIISSLLKLRIIITAIECAIVCQSVCLSITTSRMLGPRIMKFKRNIVY